MEPISPYVPLWPWLSALGLYSSHESYVLPDGRLLGRLETDRAALPALDLRYGPHRYTVLRGLHDLGFGFHWLGFDYAWALGKPWGLLGNEQAGRATAEIVRRAGPDLRKDRQIIAVFGPWASYSGDGLRRISRAGSPIYATIHPSGAYGRGGKGWEVGSQRGKERGRAAIEPCDAYLRKIGVLFEEELSEPAESGSCTLGEP